MTIKHIWDSPSTGEKQLVLRMGEAQTLHRPSCSGAAEGINGSTAFAVHAHNEVGPAPGAGPWRGVVFAVLIILRIRCAAIVVHLPQASRDTTSGTDAPCIPVDALAVPNDSNASMEGKCRSIC